MTAIDLLLKPDLLFAARVYFQEQTRETKWQSLVPEGTTAPIDLNKEKMERFRLELRKLRYDPAKYKNYMEQLGIHYPTVRCQLEPEKPAFRRPVPSVRSGSPGRMARNGTCAHQRTATSNAFSPGSRR